jgi:2-phosphosulpholactate phosphatase
VRVKVGFTPAEQVSAPLGIVIDVLRATSTICQALASGIERVVCVGEIDDARALAGPGVALAGERGNVRVDGFDYGNSPREFAGEFPGSDPLTVVTRFEQLDTVRYGEVFRGLLERGIYLAPSQYECLFPSLAHGDDEIEATVEAVGELVAR